MVLKALCILYKSTQTKILCPGQMGPWCSVSVTEVYLFASYVVKTSPVFVSDWILLHTPSSFIDPFAKFLFLSNPEEGFLTLSQPIPGSYVSAVQIFLKHWEKEKLLVTSNFSISHSVFYLFGELPAMFIKFEIIVCKLFQFGSLKFVVWERVKNIFGERIKCCKLSFLPFLKKLSYLSKTKQSIHIQFMYINWFP